MKFNMDPHEFVIWKLNNVIKGQAMMTKEAIYMSPEDKIFELQALADLRDYINHYEEYSKVIEEYKKAKGQDDEQER